MRLYPATKTLWIVIQFSIIISLVSGDCLFKKYYGYNLDIEVTKISVTQSVRGVLQCEKLCLESNDRFTAANIIFIRANLYSCELYSKLPSDYSDFQLLPTKKGKFIHRQEPLKLTITSCSTGTIENLKYVCENAFDGVLDPGDNNEWSSDQTDTNVWIRLEFGSAKKVTMVKIWWRCAGESQFSELKLAFSDGSTQTVY
ncbi:hypothetical protein LSH36_13g23027 [Paralvinella palmiformis]|uniref:DUF7402 domain-containing protein n=1 Tax=Paralvinella palmiformis TaxID=53620 RepID=A0AAD9KC73_9ANNE|nr:hypothetical protein LSH36_13g23027 [Paralvinella palmiformis]